MRSNQRVVGEDGRLTVVPDEGQASKTNNYHRDDPETIFFQRDMHEIGKEHDAGILGIPITCRPLHRRTELANRPQIHKRRCFH